MTAQRDADDRTAVVIVTFNSAREIGHCLSAVADAVKRSSTVIVVDNASADDTRDIVRREHSWVTLIANEENTGFAAGCNAGIRVAIARGFEFVYLLNPDTIVDRSFLKEAVEGADAYPEAAAVQSLLLLEGSDPGLVNSAGNQIHFLGFGYCGSFRKRCSEVGDEHREIAFASGASVLYRTAALREVGLLDEELFLYQEDMDLGIRVRLGGWSSVLAPRSRVRHRYAFNRGPWKFYWLERNRLLVLAKNLRVRTLLTIAPGLLLADVAVLLLALQQGWLAEKLRANLDLMTPRAVRHVLRGREEMKRVRVRTDRTLVAHFTARLEMEGVTTPLLDRILNPAMALAWSMLRRAIK